jgi:DNA topoisomerase-1
MGDARSLVIVESPAKARTIARFLGPKFVVESSIGHIRDLPRGAGDVPAALKKEPWARLGVDVANDFKPLYVVAADRKQHIAKLKQLVTQASVLYLATDEDREGESIAWHLLEVLKPKIPVKRMVFHEITERAIQEAIASPRELDRRLVDAQEARRILDRLYGYEVSPVLWKKVLPKLSAGRVQSVATRVLVDREQERMRFVAAAYWDVVGKFAGASGETFAATLVEVDGRRVAQGKDFGSDGKLTSSDVTLLGEAEARKLVTHLAGKSLAVASIKRKPKRRSPSPPFMTSTLQQEAARKLRFSAKVTMRTAQQLYEAGYITYMRTDSTTLSESAVRSAREHISSLFGREYLPEKPRTYANKVKNAQEAHEAIRPAGDVFRSPEEVSREVPSDQAALYELVWMRTIASQMLDAQMEEVGIRLDGHAGSQKVVFSISGNTIVFPGFLRAYVEGSDDPTAELEQKERPLPPMVEGETINALQLDPKDHQTQPPARFTEASLVHRLEELGVGRPSTYASILSTILDRGYVWKKGTALVPSFIAFAVIRLLTRHFGDLVDYAFTARMEDDLDSIAEGNQQSVPWLKRFYFGNQGSDDATTKSVAGMNSGLSSLVAERLDEIDARDINSLPVGNDAAGVPIVIRVGKHGPYLQRGEQTASLAEDQEPDALSVERCVEILEAGSNDKLMGEDPDSGLPILLRRGRFGPYVQLGEGGGEERPRTSSLLRSMTPETLDLAQSLQLLSLPRTVGVDPETGEPILAQNGRFGPYVSRGKESRSLTTEEELFSIGVEAARTLLAAPKHRQQRAASATPAKELGPDPDSGKPITVREGRFGPYVTDGEYNATLRKGDSPEDVTLNRAVELLRERRERGPAKKKTSRRTSPRSGASSTAKTSKKTSKKAPKKRSPAKTVESDGAAAETPKPAAKKAPTKAAKKAPAKAPRKKKS